MADITFYTNPMSRGQIARWALEEAGADYDQVLLGYGEPMKDEAYLAVNPMGKVPAIVHGERIVTECAAICAYLADTFIEAELAPTEAERADYYRWMFFTAGPIEQAITNKSLGVEPEEDQERMAGYGNYERAVNVLESAITGRAYICGNRFTMADVYIGSQVDWGLQFGTLPDRDAFEEYAARLRMREPYQRAKAIDGKLIEEQQAESEAEPA